MTPAINICPINGPCRNCTDRTLGCHAKCEKYIAFRKKRDEQLDVINKQKHLQADVDSYVADMKARTRKGHVHRSAIMEGRHRK